MTIPPSVLMSRGRALLKLAVAGAAVAGSPLRGRLTGGGSPAEAAASGSLACVLTPELTEGPYFLSGDKLRRNIAEKRPGTPLTLNLSVLDASTCKPLANAAVDIWHCDSGGTYSGVSGNTGRFLRGIQKTNAKGIASFDTIYPGWYQGRTVHIHVKVHVGGNEVHTGQLFFPDPLTDAVYRKAPYSARGTRTTRNASDQIFASGGAGSVLHLRKSATGRYVGTVAMGVRRTA
jgi:protocatechuate 3,4-dioxygenase beta subunit